MSSERECVDHLIQVAGNARGSLTEAIALGLLVARKWDRARAANPTAGRNVAAQRAAEFDNFTKAELDEFRATAARLLVEHDAALPRNGDGWWRGFWQGFSSAWAYSLSIAIVALVVKLTGSDLLTVLRDLFSKE